jgi:Tol biopolymer transport system component
LVAFISAQRNSKSYADEPARHFEPIAVQSGAIFSSFPAISRAGLFYQSMRMHPPDRYVLRWVHNGQSEELSFAGQALQPRLSPDGNSIDFELVANRTSTWMRFDPSTRTSTPISTPPSANSNALAISPDGKWAAFTSTKTGPQEIFLRDLSSGAERQLTGGNCNNSSPAWSLDSKSIIFASDCDRAVRLPALYRAPIPLSSASPTNSALPTHR